MKFIVDKALSPKLVVHLNNQGYEAIEVQEFAPNQPVEDKVIFDYALENNFVIITADVDYGQLLALSKKDQPSVIIFRLVDQRNQNVFNKMDYILSHFQRELSEGSLINIHETEVNIFKLPI